MGKWCFQKSNGELVDKAYLDGYLVGDRLLEGVMFEISIIDGNVFKAVPARDFDAKYLKSLNEAEWIEAVEQRAANYDIFNERPEGGDDLIVFDPETGTESPNLD